MKRKDIAGYGALALTVILLDRFTKCWALGLHDELVVNQYLSLVVGFNRGINWGLLNSENVTLFMVLNSLIAWVIMGMIGYTIICARLGQSLIGHILILSGAFCNYYDRIIYAGVIDFILFSWHSWAWPAFNIADCAIVIGIGLLVWQIFTEDIYAT